MSTNYEAPHCATSSSIETPEYEMSRIFLKPIWSCFTVQEKDAAILIGAQQKHLRRCNQPTTVTNKRTKKENGKENEKDRK
jgi:hypothetical protein